VIGGLAFSLIYALSAFVFGRAADRWIRRNVIALGLVLWSMATAAGALATGFSSLFAARFFTGLGEASLYPAAMSLLAERFPVGGRGRAMGIFGAASAIGGGLGVGLGGMLAESLGWRMVFVCYGLAGLVFLPLLLAIPEAGRALSSLRPEPVWTVIWLLISDVRLLMVWAAGTMMMAAGFGYSTWIPSYFVRERGLDVAQAGQLFGIALLLGGVFGSILGGTLADRFRKRRLAGELSVSALAAFLAVPLAAATMVSNWPPVYIVFGILAPIAVFAFFPPLQTVILEIVPPRQHGLAYAINILFLAGLGTAVGPFIVGVASDVMGSLRLGIYLTVVGMALAGILISAAGRVVRAKTEAVT
jgi:MFS family permease